MTWPEATVYIAFWSWTGMCICTFLWAMSR